MVQVTCSIAAVAKNEGGFLLEWIAHHLAVGFDKIFIATNDCDDGSDLILEEVSRLFPVFHIDNSQNRNPEFSIQRNGVQRCLAHPEMQNQDWVLHIDLDEFLDMDDQFATVQQLIAAYPRADALMLFWKMFGDNGKRFWDGGSVLDTFQKAATAPKENIAKCFVKRAAFGDIAAHAPKSPKKPRPRKSVILSTRKDRFHHRRTKAPNDQLGVRLISGAPTWDYARINHYMHKSQDLVKVVRSFRGDADDSTEKAEIKRIVGSRRYKRFNANNRVDLSIQKFRDARLDYLNKMMDVPSIRKLHYDAQRWTQDRLLQVMRTQHDDAPPSSPQPLRLAAE